ncbi:ATP-binding protein [Sphingomonas sp.]|uniref:ATP-binding protein n=1 Tax=Sphingomonas sp. TaxID=28214 RepID=UPI001B0E6894|nr:ATP-binding protein [Sphingomonas sp.]MBO9712665.1 HAMP domain-containing protein [Sphingomonas sp.]
MSRGYSIVAPIVLLVGASVAFTALALFAVTFSGPPRRPVPVRPALVAQALKTGAVPASLATRLTLTDGAVLPEPRYREHVNPAMDAEIARAAGGGEVHGSYFGPPWIGSEMLFGSFRVAMRLPGAAPRWRVVETPEEPWFTRWHAMNLVAILSLIVLMTFIAWRIARTISHPIERLAAAAAETRLGTRRPIPAGGPREVRELAAAIAAMEARILEAAEGRTAMLAAIAHDLGTPLARLAFRVEKLPEGARERAEADIDEMRTMLNDVLRFVRDARGDMRARTELGSLIESVADDLHAIGRPVTAKAGPRLVILADPVSLRRLLTNLADNAVRYGKAARIAWASLPGWAEVVVDDDGPGFGAAPAALFEPFVRGETSRSRETGGSGLGLAIVRAIAETHGGYVTLENRPEGGGRARVRLPLEPTAAA